MANRVLLGERSGQQGLWVSKPGVNVLTAGADQLLLSAGEASMQAIAAGSVSMAGSINDTGVTVTIPSTPYVPLVLLNATPPGHQYNQDGIRYFDSAAPRYRRVSDTQLLIGVFWNSFQPMTFTVDYIVFARPISG